MIEKWFKILFISNILMNHAWSKIVSNSYLISNSYLSDSVVCIAGEIGLGQEPMSRSMQLHYSPVPAFSQTDLFLDRISLE